MRTLASNADTLYPGQTCGAGLLGYKTEIPEKHMIYSSEFESHKVFQKQQDYIDHLLELSVMTGGSRPIRSYHKKLRNLLEQPVCESAVRELSRRLFHTEDGWQNARWEHERVKMAVKELEQGLPGCIDGSDATPNLHKVGQFLEELFQDRAMSTSITASSPVGEKADLAPKVEINSEPGDDRSYEHRLPEHTPKRPLSFESSVAPPLRRPPNPSTPAAYAAQKQRHPRQYQYHQSQDVPPYANAQATMIGIPEVPYSNSARTYGPSHETQHVIQSMPFWPQQQSAQQPPPYEGTFSHDNSTQQQTYAADMTASQDLAALDFNSSFLPFADLSVTSTMASPVTYLPSADEGMGFYSSSPQPLAHIPPEQQQHANSAITGYSSSAFASLNAGYQTVNSSDFDPSQYRYDGNM